MKPNNHVFQHSMRLDLNHLITSAAQIFLYLVPVLNCATWNVSGLYSAFEICGCAQLVVTKASIAGSSKEVRATAKAKEEQRIILLAEGGDTALLHNVSLWQQSLDSPVTWEVISRIGGLKVANLLSRDTIARIEKFYSKVLCLLDNFPMLCRSPVCNLILQQPSGYSFLAFFDGRR